MQRIVVPRPSSVVPTVLVLIALSGMAGAHPNLARGFDADKMYQFNDVDSVNLYNGNLSMTIPLGQEYKGNGTLSYRFGLVYNSKVWDFERRYYGGNASTQGDFNKAVPSKSSNAGMGWMLTLGRLLAPSDPVNDPESLTGFEWAFQSPDGSVHSFNGMFAATDPVSTGFTKDGSFLRLKKPATNARDVEHPDGTVYRFISGGNQYWLWRISDPFGNYLSIKYYDAAGAEILIASSYGNAMSWKVREYTNANVLVRTHTVRFEAHGADGLPSNYLRQVKWVDLAAFNGTTASYELSYADTVTVYGCNGQYRDNDATPNPTVPLLMAVYLPDGATQSTKSNYLFTYHSSSCVGALASVRLPTLGRIEYEYGPYLLPTSFCLEELSTSDPAQVLSNTQGITLRESFSAAGTKIASTTYTPSLQSSGYAYACGIANSKDVYGAVQIRVDSDDAPAAQGFTRTDHSFSVWPDDISDAGPYGARDFGLPYTRATCPAGNGLCLSTRTYDCSSGTCGATAKSETYVQYEGDTSFNAPERNNRRLARSRTVYRDDGDRFVETQQTGYDGHGHYRNTETRSGSGLTLAFGTLLLRAQSTNYNPAFGTLAVDPVTWAPSTSVSTLPASSPWILGTYTDSEVSQPGAATEKMQFCFDQFGTLTRKRTLEGTSIGTKDLLWVATHDSPGNLVREENFGANQNQIDASTNDLCATPLPAHNSHSFRIDHTWQFGTLATSQYITGTSGGGFNHFEIDREIDQNTGLAAAESVGRSANTSESTDGLRTDLEYDALGRMTWRKPASGHDAWTSFSYTRATSSSSPASVAIDHFANGTTSPAIGSAQYQFDSFGRVLREGVLLPSSQWMYRETLRNGGGAPLEISEWDTTLSPLPRTTYVYDWAGRTSSVQPPTGNPTTHSYTGGRLVARTQAVATNSSGGESFFTTTETRDDLGRLISVSEPVVGLTTYTYDAANRLTKVCSDASGSSCGQTREFDYDGRGILTRERHPEYAGLWKSYIRHNARGQVTRSWIGSVGGPYDLTFGYDRAARPTITRVTTPSRMLREFTYGASNTSGNRMNGKLRYARRWNWHTGFYALVEELYVYGGRGNRPSSRRTTVETFDYADVLLGEKIFNQSWTWWHLGDPRVIGYPTCSGLSPCNVAGARDITRDYTNGWLTKVREGSTSWGTLTYHPNGMLDTVTHLNGVESRYGLDPQKMQRPASVAAVYGATTYWNSGAYAYDGSGNVKTIGADYFYYDGVQRLVEGASERVSSSVYKRQRQTYDVYGNITNIATTINGSTSNRPISVDAATNRLNATNYDPAGNQTSWDGIYTYGYDSLGMMVSLQGGNRDIVYFYTADDERVWEYDHNANRSDYTIRDLDKKVLRVFDENIGVWIWKKDMIHRGSAALASASYAGFYHYTVDHLGTPRYISDAARAQIGRHAYYPFGQESTSDTQNQEFAKFTGHERDTNFTGTLDYLDYMHARYYNPMLGRFLSVDPGGYFPQFPLSWNRYSYALNNPVNNTDPDGRCVAPWPCPRWLATGTRTVATQVGSRAAAGSAAGPVGVAVASVGVTGWQIGRGIGTATIGGRTIDSRVEDLFLSMMDNTRHGDDRANDPSREVDLAKVKAHGDRYIDAEEGTTVYVHGGSVVIENEAGQLVSQWNDQTKQETRKKEKEGKWRRVPRNQDESELE